LLSVSCVSLYCVLCICVSLYCPLRLSVYPSVYSVYLCVSVSVSLCLRLSVCVSLYMYRYHSAASYLSTKPPARASWDNLIQPHHISPGAPVLPSYHPGMDNPPFPQKLPPLSMAHEPESRDPGPRGGRTVTVDRRLHLQRGTARCSASRLSQATGGSVLAGELAESLGAAPHGQGWRGEECGWDRGGNVEWGR
jgi:hypothetical protein